MPDRYPPFELVPPDAVPVRSRFRLLPALPCVQGVSVVDIFPARKFGEGGGEGKREGESFGPGAP